MAMVVEALVALRGIDNRASTDDDRSSVRLQLGVR